MPPKVVTKSCVELIYTPSAALRGEHHDRPRSVLQIAYFVSGRPLLTDRQAPDSFAGKFSSPGTALLHVN